MLALTLRHPFAWAIVVLGKDVENRTWEPRQLKVGDYFAIHGGVAPTSRPALEAVLDVARELALKFPIPQGQGTTLADAIRPGIVAVCRFGGTVTESSSYWFQGPIGWVLAERFVLPEPVPCKGAQGLWTLPPDVTEAVRSQYRKAKAKR